jgi:N6-adenosine-specific RNA methylase IME4
MNLPTHKRYQVIYADPPWEYNSAGPSIVNQCATHYPCMSHEAMKALPIRNLADESCALFLWTTGPKLPEAIDLIRHWGFVYKTVFKVWRKVSKSGGPVCNPGWWSRSSTELLLVATIGYPLKKWKTTNIEPQEFASTREEHSKKPSEIRDAVHNFMNVSNRIELFARCVTMDWDAWGNEIPGNFHEGSGENGHITTGTHRTIGSQCNFDEDEKKKKRKANACGGVGHHKPECTCFVCKSDKKKRTPIEDEDEETKKKRCGGVGHHKPECNCFVCKKKKIPVEDQVEENI